MIKTSTKKKDLEMEVPSKVVEKSNEEIVLSENLVGGVKSRKQVKQELEIDLEERQCKLSSPRPRRSKNPTIEPVVNEELYYMWESLPKNIDFLSTFFDDSVTAHYYRGEFRESRKQLIRRLIDPELTLEEVSRLLGVCPATVRRYTNREWLEHIRTKGGQRRFKLSGLVKFVENHGRNPG